MAEYRIVARIDPQTADGSAKVKQDLKGIDTAAAATGASINAAFDQSKFDRTIGTLVNNLVKLDATLSGVGQKTGENTRLNAANTQSQTQMEAALRRVLMTVDQTGAETQRLNALMADAKMLFDKGALSAENYAKVQSLVAESTKTATGMSNAGRMGVMVLGEQFRQFGTEVSLGISPIQAFNQQIGQVIFALQIMAQNGGGGALGTVAKFMGGPWGIALSTGIAILAPFVAKLLQGNDALGDAIEKLKKDAEETENNRKAKEAFNQTLAGQIALQKQLNDELDKSIMTQRQQQQLTLAVVRQNVNDLQSRQPGKQTEVNNQQAVVDRYAATLKAGGGVGVAQVAAAEAAKLQQLKNDLANITKGITEGERAIREAEQPLIQNDVEASFDKKKAAADAYTVALGRLNRQLAIGKGNTGPELFDPKTQKGYGATISGVNESEYRQQLAIITKARDDAERAAKVVTDGVATFRSREQAIGLAGRELQQSGLRVGENNQFGGVTMHHAEADHAKYAIDVNKGTGVVEANVPDIRAQFDALAQRYQQRGFTVYWNGWVYEANGKGQTRRIAAGSDQHHDHMHVEAPTSIIGKPTQASTEEQARRDEAAAATKQGRMTDFVQNIVDTSATKGVPANRPAQLQSAIQKTQDDFRRQFDQEMSDPDKAKVTKALTDADAREISQHFQTAYVDPLKAQEAALGKTGLQLEIYNKKIAEQKDLGRPLTDIENAEIENSVLRGDQLQREAKILEDIKGPLEEYRAQIAALNDLLAKGSISQADYNLRIDQMKQSAAGAISGLPGSDPKTGANYADIGKQADEQVRYDEELKNLRQHREDLLSLGVDYDAAEAAAHQQHVDNLRRIDDARKDQQLSSAQDIAGSLTSIMGDAFGKQSKIYRAAFMVEKAIAIARSIVAIETGIAQAAALPFPANLPAMASVAAATASIVANIKSVTLQFEQGGYTGDAGRKQAAGIVHGQEFVVNADATAQHRPLLEAINAGRTARQAGVASGMATAGGGPQVVVQPNPAPQVTIRQINVSDPRMVADYFATPEGDQLFVNLVNQHPELIRQHASGG